MVRFHYCLVLILSLPQAHCIIAFISVSGLLLIIHCHPAYHTLFNFLSFDRHRHAPAAVKLSMSFAKADVNIALILLIFCLSFPASLIYIRCTLALQAVTDLQQVIYNEAKMFTTSYRWWVPDSTIDKLNLLPH